MDFVQNMMYRLHHPNQNQGKIQNGKVYQWDLVVVELRLERHRMMLRNGYVLFQIRLFQKKQKSKWHI